jgi:hypothetical protein
VLFRIATTLATAGSEAKYGQTKKCSPPRSTLIPLGAMLMAVRQSNCICSSGFECLNYSWISKRKTSPNCGNAALENAFDAERARGEKHADALMRIARTRDDRVDELKALHGGVVAKLENEKTALKVGNAAA